MKVSSINFLLIVFCACSQKQPDFHIQPVTETSLVVLGTVQDAGSPHIACKKDCCKELFLNPDKDRKVVSLGLIDPASNTSYLFEATPDISQHVKILKEFGGSEAGEIPAGIFLTHAHIGHYAGLMYLGKEAMNANGVPVFVMPRMKTFLETNGPWSQLVTTNNIVLHELADKKPEVLSPTITVIPFTVPHRDEYSETVGYIIQGPTKKALFIPDIDKWEKWSSNISDEIQHVDYAFIDATFYDAEEINNRDIREIPHPFIVESMALFSDLPANEKKKVFFIHMNHTNPALNEKSEQTQQILSNGFNIARMYDVFPL